MNENNPLAGLMLAAFERYGDSIAVRTPARDVSYSQLDQSVTDLAVNLKVHAIGRESLVGVQVRRDPFLAAVAILALTRLGAKWLEYDAYLKQQDSIRLTHLLHDNTGWNDDSEEFGHAQGVFIGHSLYSRPADSPEPHMTEFAGYESADDTWYIAASSGTTGSRKNMAISGRMFYRAITRLTEYPIAAHPFIATDLFRRTAYIASLHFMNTLRLGGTYVLSRDYDFLIRQPACLVVGSPAHLTALLKDIPPPDRPCLLQARVVGGALRPQFLSKLLQYFETVRVSYGSTETGSLCTRLLTHSTDDRSLGPCYGGVELEIVDEDDRPLAAESEGMIRVKADSQVTGYLNAPAASKQAFRDGWFYPGDRGYLSSRGELYVTGRVKDELNIGGAKLNASVLDETLQAHEQVTDGMCFIEVNAEGEQTLAVVISLDADADKKTVVKDLVYAFLINFRDQGHPLPKKIYQLARIPRNANGKLMRDQAASEVQHLKPIALIGNHNS